MHRVKKEHKPLPGWVQSAFAWLDFHAIALSGVLAVVLAMLVEILARRSPGEALQFIFHNPMMFCVNALIIFVTLVVPLLIPKKRYFAMAVVSAVWLILGIVEFVITSFRVTPLTYADFAVAKDVAAIFTVYLSIPEIILIGVGIVLLVLGMIWLFRRLPNAQAKLIPSLICSCGTALLCFVVFYGGPKAGLFPSSMPNLHEAYDDYGFTYCFTCSMFDHGIAKPDSYSEKVVSDVVSDVTENGEGSSSQYANIIMVQLESFIDMNEVQNVQCSENPVPFFEELKQTCSSGYLTVPVVGAGTANTEFEAISQMSLAYFGTGEYPYNTIMRTNTCETLPYDLKELGYSTHAIHNNTATFYSRDKVYANLGFDTFTPLEYMNDVSYNPLGWAKDDVLVEQIVDSLVNTVYVKDFVYCVSVQGHGKYPREQIDDSQRITVEGLDDAGLTAAYEYYVNQTAEMDDFVRALIKKLSHFSERTIVVLYGDHLPSLELEPENMKSGSVMKTEYVIWTNYTSEKQDMDLNAYQLGSRLMEMCGYSNGLLTKLHQGRADDPDYQNKLQLLQYDMLYGEMDCWNGVNPYAPTDLQMGVLPVEITDVSTVGAAMFITGKNFTPFSTVYCGEEAIETIFINPQTLLLLKEGLQEGDELTVAMLSRKGTVLGTTAPHSVTKEDLVPVAQLPASTKSGG